MSVIYIASGATSSLAASFITTYHSLFTIYATLNMSRADFTIAPTLPFELQKLGVRLVDSVSEIDQPVDAIVWLSRRDKPEDALALEKLATIAPTLAISSGAITNFLRGKQEESTLNGYQVGKVLMIRVAGVSSLIPGFYGQDIDLPAWASRGLHGDNTPIIFGSQPAPNAFKWNDSKSVTPVSYICTVMKKWLESPPHIGTTARYAACSAREYRRWELFEAATGALPLSETNLEVPIRDPIYEEFEALLPLPGDKEIFDMAQKVKM